MSTKNINSDSIMNTYGRKDVVFEKGSGVWLYDDAGNKYLDFVAGVAVNCLGHSHPAIVETMKSQVENLIHVSNIYWTQSQLDLGEKLCKESGLSSAFFCNSGTESLEAAMKIARKFGKAKSDDKTKIVVLEKAFHGRTIGALSLTWNEKYKKPFGPLVDNIVAVPLNDTEGLKDIMDENVCAIIMEPIQGEGGIYNSSQTFIETARAMADTYDALLIFDEVQCGMGRTGYLFAHQLYDVKPDVLCLAKGLGAGMPIGAVVVNARADVLVPGDHGSTFGGNPLACATGNAVMDIIGEASFLDQVKSVSAYLIESFNALNEKYDFLKEIRGSGLILGVETKYKSAEIIEKALEEGLLLIGAGENTVRIIPPLVISKEEIDIFIDKFEKILLALS